MLSTTIPAIESTRTCPAVAIWLVAESPLDEENGARTHPIQPFPPSIAVVDFIPAADFKRKTGRPQGQPLEFLIPAADVRPERVTLGPRVPEQNILMVASASAKPCNACAPRTNGIVEVELASQPGRADRTGRGLSMELPVPPPFTCEPRTQTEAWRAAALKPSHPLPSEPWPLAVRPQAGGSAVTRPKQALRELVLPSPRPWHSLAIWWESFRGFHIAVPMPEAITEVRLTTPVSIALWNNCAEAYLPGLRFLGQSAEKSFELQPSFEGALAKLPHVELVEALAPFSPGLDEPFRGSKPFLDAEPFPQAGVPETLPLPISAKTPSPVIGLPEGLLVWTGTINSYTRRSWRLPRLHEGGRTVHTLQLAPAPPVTEPFEMSAA